MNDKKSVVVQGSSETTIIVGDQTYNMNFEPGVTSDEIVNASLAEAKLSGTTPDYVRNQIVNNINMVEQQSQDTPQKERSHEHSFRFNIGIFEYGYKYKTTKKI